MKIKKLLVESYLAALIVFFLSGCSQNQSKVDKDFYQGKPEANIKLLVAEIDNGGFNQYFFISSGVDCFETLRALRSQGKTKSAEIVQQAINQINPEMLSEDQLIDKIRKREVTELDDEKVSDALYRLDSLFCTEPDGSLVP